MAIATLALAARTGRAEQAGVRVSDVGEGWAGSSINTVIFRHNSLVSFGDTQYTAFYDNDARVVLAKRKLSDEKWELKRTELTGNVTDAHNTITLGVDGSGIVHMAWDHHGNNLNYVHTTAAGSLELSQRLKMDGVRVGQVTYPEFYTLPDGDMLFLYRVGASGNGDLVLKRYHTATKEWTTLQQLLISGENRQNAYPEFCVDAKGTFHLGWVWRASPDVATNHNICYARSADGGKTWTDSTGKALAMPITAATGEVALAVPQRSDLMNQTTMAADAAGHPYIVTYFRPEGQSVPQIEVVYNDGRGWKSSQVGTRKTGFTLAGGGTKRIPLSRPLILVDSAPTPPRVYVVYRDLDHQEHVTLAQTSDIAKGDWTTTDLTSEAYDAWEPSCDPTLWEKDRTIALFLQKTEQVDNGDNTLRKIEPTEVRVLEYKP